MSRETLSKEVVKDLYSKYKSCRTVGKLLGVSKTTVERFCHQEGINLRSQGRPIQPQSWKAVVKSSAEQDYLTLEKYLNDHKDHLPKRPTELAKLVNLEPTVVRRFLTRRTIQVKDQIRSLPAFNFLEEPFMDIYGRVVPPYLIRDYELTVDPMTLTVTIFANMGLGPVRKIVLPAKALIERLRKI